MVIPKKLVYTSQFYSVGETYATCQHTFIFNCRINSENC